ncbi:DUF2201 family putative metallopeptidase [Methylobacillus sp. Pita2]|uniref:DUF2201 family putative metallopeptidase n=1 Tax=Methylobacillus sp. Pita2 TaxID=3383245 RepID=UPI0038B5E6B8
MSQAQAVAQRQQYLLSDENLSFQEELDDMKTYLVGEEFISGYGVPRFGMLSIFGRSVPMYAYDHPDIKRNFGTTAFTDGANIFYCTDFLDQILQDDNGRKGTLFLALHEISHNAFRHFFRCLEYPADIANIAQDYSINTRLRRDFVESQSPEKNVLAPLPAALACGIGFKEGDIEKYAHRSEEDICQELMKNEDDMIKALQDAMGKGQQGQKGQPGSGKPSQGKSQGGSGSPGDDGEDGDGGEPQDGDGGDPQDGKGQSAGMGTEHLVSPEQLARVLRGAGLGHVVDKLKMPVNADGELDNDKVKAQEQQQMSSLQNAVTEMAAHKQRLGDRTPGAHSQSYAEQIIGKINKPKISWKTSVKTAILGNGVRTTHSMDVPGDAYFIDPAYMNMTNPLYLGARVPSRPNSFVLALLDTSGSMHPDWCLESASEIFGLLQANRNSAPDVVFMHIDTVIRGNAIVITPQNVEKMIKDAFAIRGGGGTSLTMGINMALNSPEVLSRVKKGMKMSSLLYFTDLGDAPPLRENLPEKLPKNFLYLASPGTYNDHFANAVSDYATVVSMGERQDIDLTMDKVKVTPIRKAGQ